MKRAAAAAALTGAALAGLAALPALADITYPARLELTEVSTGTYDISFNLPLVQGRILRAEPTLPEICRDQGERQVVTTAAGRSVTWRATCSPTSLIGEVIFVAGLLGTQTDLAFTMTTLDGRMYRRVLRPSRPGFLVPPPPSPPALAVEAMVSGARRVLAWPLLWLLLATAALLGARRGELAAASVAFGLMHLSGQWLGGNLWIQVAPLQRDLVVALAVAIPAVALAGGGERWSGWLRPLWPLAAAIGLISGGAAPETLSPDGLARAEQLLALIFFGVGVALGVALLSFIGVQAVSVLSVLGGDARRREVARRLGYGIGALATGVALAVVIESVLFPVIGPDMLFEPAMLALLLAPSLALTGQGAPRGATVAGFAMLLAVGTAAGLLRLPVPLGSTLIAAGLLLLGAALAAGRPLSRRGLLLIAAVSVPATAWWVTQQLVANVSRSTAAAVGTGVLAVVVFWATQAVCRGLRAGDVPVPLRLLGGAIAVHGAAVRWADIRAWFDLDAATELALGVVPVPALALVLLAAAVLARPRRRRVVEALGAGRRRRPTHWVLLGAACLAIPLGTVAVDNPFFEPHAPRGEDARRVVTRVLSDTYLAFNLDDENELYDQLAESVAGDLVDDLYLDSRRRLTTGTREGAQVTVRAVEVLEIGEPRGDAGAGEFSYESRWVVTARVQHLQHVHHRRNIYSGMLRLVVDGSRWKIAGVELFSEDREVVPWQSG